MREVVNMEDVASKSRVLSMDEVLRKEEVLRKSPVLSLEEILSKTGVESISEVEAMHPVISKEAVNNIQEVLSMEEVVSKVEVPEHIARKFLDLIDGESEPRAYGSNVIPRINIPGEDITAIEEIKSKPTHQYP